MWIIQIEGDKYRTVSGIENGKIVTSEWTTALPKNLGKANETSGPAQALKEAQAKWDKKLAGQYSTTKETAGAQYFEPMLAHDYKKYKDKLTWGQPIYSQPKLDGIRCIVKKDGMWSRNGKPIVSAPHIRKALDDVFAKYPDLVLDGELYADKFKNNFNEICSLAKRTKPTADELRQSEEQLEYWVYDGIPASSQLPAGANFMARLRYIVEALTPRPTSIKMVDTITLEGEWHVDLLMESYVSEGFEGQIIRLDKPYENKRSRNLLKHKNFIEEEFEVTGVVEGTGNRSGMAGYVELKTKDGLAFSANPKGGFEFYRRLLQDSNKVIGKFATVIYFNLTPDGIPRFPVVKEIRDYE